VKTTVHGWEDNWFDGFISVSQVRVNVDGYLAASTPLHKLTICGVLDPAGCHDRTETYPDDVPLSLADYPKERLGLAIDLHREG
jgi:hypothetical protein